MSNVIDLLAEKAKRSATDPWGDYSFSIDIYTGAEGQPAGRLHGFDFPEDQSKADLLRAFAGTLEQMAALLRDDAQQMQPDEDGFVLGRFTVLESSRVRAWVSDKIESEPQADWMRERLRDAQGLV